MTPLTAAFLRHDERDGRYVGRLVVPGKQSIPIWLTMLIGVVAALIGTFLARAVGVNTSGFSWLELLFQVGLAAVGVAIARTGGRRGHRTER